MYDAPLSMRLATWLVDSVLQMAFYLVGMLGAGFLLGPETVFYVMDVPEFFVLFVVNILYYVPQELLMKRTFGKMVCGTMVVTSSGEELTMMHVFGRSVFRLIPLEPVSFLIFRRGWHDSLSKTRVVNARGR